MLSLDEIIPYSDKLDRALGLMVQEILYPPDVKCISISEFQAYFNRNLDNILLTPTILKEKIKLTFLEACGLYSSVASKNFYPLGRFVSRQNTRIITEFVKRNYSEFIDTYTEGLKTPTLDKIVNSSIEEINYFSLTHPELLGNPKIIMMWLRQNKMPLQAKSVSEIEEFVRDYPITTKFNIALSKNDEKLVVEILNDFPRKIMFRDLNLDYIQSPGILTIILTNIRDSLRGQNLRSIALNIVKSGNIQMLETLLQHSPRVLNVTTWQEYKEKETNPSVNTEFVRFELTKSLVDGALKSKSLSMIKKILSSIDLSFNATIEKPLKEANNIWIQEAFLTSDERIIGFVINKLEYSNYNRLIYASFLSGKMKIIERFIAKYGSPKNWLRAILLAINSKSASVLQFALTGNTKNIELWQWKNFLEKSLSSSFEVLDTFINFLVSKDLLKDIQLENPVKECMINAIEEKTPPYTVVDIEKIRIILSTFPIHETDTSITDFLIDVAKNIDDSYLPLEIISSIVDISKVDWESVKESSQLVLNYRVQWWLSYKV